MSESTGVRLMTRRELLASGVAAGAALTVGAGFVFHAGEAWAVETKALKPATMATLIQMSRDIYPHDRIPDKNYAIVAATHDETASGDPAYLEMIESGVAGLDALAAARGAGSYVATGWEADRVALLKEIEGGALFGAVRGSLVVGLYNQKEIWPIFGYEGSSHEHGGYIDRGFDDIAWL